MHPSFTPPGSPIRCDKACVKGRDAPCRWCQPVPCLLVRNAVTAFFSDDDDLLGTDSRLETSSDGAFPVEPMKSSARNEGCLMGPSRQTWPMSADLTRLASLYVLYVSMTVGRSSSWQGNSSPPILNTPSLSFAVPQAIPPRVNCWAGGPCYIVHAASVWPISLTPFYIHVVIFALGRGRLAEHGLYPGCERGTVAAEEELLLPPFARQTTGAHAARQKIKGASQCSLSSDR